jgi:TRAP-type transport system periplasmic protein
MRKNVQGTTTANAGSRNTRRDALKLFAAATAAPLVPSAAWAQGTDKFNMKVAISIPDTHPTVVALKAACDEILKKSNGRLTMEVYSNGQLGSDTDTVAQVRSGAIDFVCTANQIWGNLVPVASINVVAFAFPDYATVWKAMDGDLGAHIRGTFDKLNLVPVSKLFDHGFRHITNSVKPINTPADLAGMKLRVPASPILTSLFKGLGASPTNISFGELYLALQTKVVDGEENALPTIDAGKFYEVQKYCSYSAHAWDAFSLVGNKRNWTALPEDLRTLVVSTMDAHALKQRVAHETLNAQLETKLKAAGMEFNKVADIAPFRAALQKAGYYSEWQTKFGPEAWALLEKYTGKLA